MSLANPQCLKVFNIISGSSFNSSIHEDRRGLGTLGDHDGIMKGGNEGRKKKPFMSWYTMSLCINHSSFAKM